MVLRRYIAILMLLLFTGQAVLAGADNHFASTDHGSGSEQSFSSDAHHDDTHHSNEQHHGENSPSGLVDLGCDPCCHAQGHCHTFALPGVIPPLISGQGSGSLLIYSHSYHSIHRNSLFRPPISA